MKGLKAVKLREDLTLYVGQSVTMSEVQAEQYAAQVWALTGPRWQRAVRVLAATALAAVRKVDPLPSGCEWPPLPRDIEHGDKALDARFVTLGTHDLSAEEFKAIYEAVQTTVEVTKEEEKKPASG